MGGNFRWVLCSIDDPSYNELVLSDNLSSGARRLTRAQEEVYSLFQFQPEKLLPQYPVRDHGYGRLSAPKGAYIDDPYGKTFASLFVAPGNIEIFHKVFRIENMLAFVSGEAPPAEVLFYALGAAKAGKLPGCFGNMLIRREAVGSALDSVVRCLETIDSNSWDRARRIISACSAGEPSARHDEEIRTIFDALRSGLESARSRGDHFLSISIWLG